MKLNDSRLCDQTLADFAALTDSALESKTTMFDVQMKYVEFACICHSICNPANSKKYREECAK